MDFKPMFPSLNVLWTRWSAYQIKPHQWGGEYLIPAEGATDLTYNCAEQPGPLVADALELGRQLHMGAPDKNRLCAAFAARYGLLGLNAEKGEGATEDPNVPPCYRPLNSWEYGEDVSFFQSNFVMLYQHFLTVQGELVPTPNPRVMDLSGFLSYRLTSGPNPQLVWEGPQFGIRDPICLCFHDLCGVDTSEGLQKLRKGVLQHPRKERILRD